MSASGARSTRAIGTPTGTTAGPSTCSGAAASTLIGSSRRARASARGSIARCQAPAQPGRLSAVGASKRTAYGIGRSTKKLAVTVETTAARAGGRRVALCRAASASTRSVNAGWRRSAPARPTVTGITAQVAPASRTSAANASSFRRQPSVVRHDSSATSTLTARSLSSLPA